MDIDADCFLHGTVRPVDTGWVLDYTHDGPAIPLLDPDGIFHGKDEQDCTVGVDVVDPSFAGVNDEPTGIWPDGDKIVLLGDRRSLDTLIERPGSRIEDLTFDAGCWPITPEHATVSTTNSPSALPCRRIGHENQAKIEASALELRQILSSPDPFGEEPIDTLRFEFHPARDHVRIVVPGVPLWANYGWLECPPGRFFERVGEWAKAAAKGSPSPWNCGNAPMAETLDFEYGVEADVLRVRPRVSATPLGVYPADGLRFDCQAFVEAWIRDTKQFLEETDSERAESLRETVAVLASHVDDVGPKRTVSSDVSTAKLGQIAGEESYRQRHAIETLVERGAEDQLRALATDLQHAGDQWLLADALGRVAGQSAAVGLFKLLQDDQTPGVREAVGRALDGIEATEIAQGLTENCDGTTAKKEELEQLLETASILQVRAQAARALSVVAEEPPVRQLLDALQAEDDVTVRQRITDVLSSLPQPPAETTRAGLGERFHERELELVAEAPHPELREERLELVPVPDPPSQSRVLAGLTDSRSAIRELSAIAAREHLADPLYEQLFNLLEGPLASDAVRKRVAETIAVLADVSKSPPQAQRLFEAYHDAAKSNEPGKNSLRETLKMLSNQYDGGDFFGAEPTWVIARYYDAIATDEYWINPTVADTVIERIVAGATTERLLSETRDDPKCSYRVARILARCDSEPVRELLTALQDHQHPDVADAAQESL